MKPASQALSAIVIASALLLSTQPANAQQVCRPHEKAAFQLEEKFDEQVVGRGLTPNGKAMFEVFVGESGSWTVLVSATLADEAVLSRAARADRAFRCSWETPHRPQAQGRRHARGAQQRPPPATTSGIRDGRTAPSHL